ncbi:MAG TPA: chloride channel protein [Capsulimonadaceae bacterium]|nr:chloride channel protein [Capsulimonadaceae bacterium]
MAADRWTARIPFYYLLLPVALPLCVWLIRTFAPSAKGHGTEAVITAIHKNYGKVNLPVAPIKLLATVITLAAGGSVGKEGPCAQIGAAIASAFADIMRLNNEDRRRLVICGVAAGFAAVFGTPISGALFGVEVLYLGRIEYPVLFPCIVAGIVAHLICRAPAPVPLLRPDAFHFPPYVLVLLSIVAGAWFGFVALVLIESMRALERSLRRWVERYPYAVACGGGLFLAELYYLLWTTHLAPANNYAQLGIPTIDLALMGSAIPAFAFLFKIISTSATLETGGSGGIITPIFSIGATAGWAFAHVFHLPRGAFAAFGFVAVTAAAANTPIAASVMGLEILPMPLSVYAALCACTAYLLVGHRSVYASQKLGFVKSMALTAPEDITIGEITRSHLRIRNESQLAALARRAKRARRKRKPPTSDD